MRLVNLCPHPVTVFGNGTTPVYDLPAPETPARTVYEDKFIGVNIKRKTVVGVEGLPPPEKGTLYVVSNAVRCSLPARRDLASPV